MRHDYVITGSTRNIQSINKKFIFLAQFDKTNRLVYVAKISECHIGVKTGDLIT